eukprot:NODE_882_length_735_cov_584.434402_g679_i0.p1 GENE.NODE_882_length_735_cov_584.434402_g679_i0~~NODE_882_length_735_cov_584.434402_g679_i0.p1  ORF type:complete len:215 (-),score=63.07 NODE_882_length_735_cov_584.434402_g679_i0:91-708(-)
MGKRQITQVGGNLEHLERRVEQFRRRRLAIMSEKNVLWERIVQLVSEALRKKKLQGADLQLLQLLTEERNETVPLAIQLQKKAKERRLQEYKQRLAEGKWVGSAPSELLYDYHPNLGTLEQHSGYLDRPDRKQSAIPQSPYQPWNAHNKEYSKRAKERALSRKFSMQYKEPPDADAQREMALQSQMHHIVGRRVDVDKGARKRSP